jgi:hypothetical protein
MTIEHQMARVRVAWSTPDRDRERVELGWPTGLEPVTFGSTFRCSAD